MNINLHTTREISNQSLSNHCQVRVQDSQMTRRPRFKILYVITLGITCYSEKCLSNQPSPIQWTSRRYMCRQKLVGCTTRVTSFCITTIQLYLSLHHKFIINIYLVQVQHSISWRIGESCTWCLLYLTTALRILIRKTIVPNPVIFVTPFYRNLY